MNTSWDCRAFLAHVDPGRFFRCLAFRQMGLTYGTWTTWTQGAFTDFRNLVEPDPPVLRDEFGLLGTESKTDSGVGTLHEWASSSFAWPVFLGNLGLGSGWPRLGSGGPPEVPDVDYDITNKLSQTIAQQNGKSNDIDEQISRAGKNIGLIWKLSCSIPRFAVENIYTAYIRPQIEYANVVYSNCTKEQITRLEALQRRAAIACTRAYNRTPTKRILDELGWPTLEYRRNYSSLVQLYKIRHGLTPIYLHSILPQRQGTHRYPTRRVEDYVLPITRTARYHKSCIPATCKKWNQLNEDIKCKPTVNSLKAALKKKTYSVTKHKHYSYGKDKWALAHTRMRLGLKD